MLLQPKFKAGLNFQSFVLWYKILRLPLQWILCHRIQNILFRLLVNMKVQKKKFTALSVQDVSCMYFLFIAQGHCDTKLLCDCGPAVSALDM